MGARSRELWLLACMIALVAAKTPALRKGVKDTNAKDATLSNDVFYDDYPDEQQVLFNENKPCPRDCICNMAQGYRIAKCNRLEIGTQKFGEDITDIVVENSDPAFPIDLQDYIFRDLGLHRVATVKIVNSTIGTIGPKAFYDMTDLYSVNLSNNKLKNIHPETFAQNKKLLLLTLTYNPLTFPTVGSKDYFLNASSVQELDISHCNIEEVSPDTFKNMQTLMYLNLADNNLSKLSRDTFSKLLDLEELDLSDNNLKYLPTDIFSENTELVTLHIQKNPIETVYGLDISDLLTLNAGQTEIKFVGPSMFNGMKYLANLNLSGNSIEKIHNQAFHNLTELNYLDLSYNDLDLVSNILIKENIELDVFKISNNPKLKHLPVQGFDSSADTFNIYLFDASYCGLEEIYDDSLRTFTALTQINLAGNNLQTISSQVFAKCNKLVEINLSYNQLTTLDNKVFAKNSELAKLNLQGNPLKVLSAEVFVHTPMLKWLDLSHAHLTSLWKADKAQPATILRNLNFLNVSHNRITVIEHTELENLNKLTVLDISNNMLTCSREFENLMTWLSKHNVSSSEVEGKLANLGKDAKDEDGTYSWEALTHKTCGTPLPLPHPVEPLGPISDEIWKTVDTVADGNFDLKNTLDDAKLPDDKVSTTESNKLDDLDEDADEDDDDEDDVEGNDADDEDDEEDGMDDDYDEEVNLNVKLVEKPEKPKPSTEMPIAEKVKIDLEQLENQFEKTIDREPEVFVEETIITEERDQYYFVTKILIAIFACLLLLLVIAKLVYVMCSRRQMKVRYNSAIISAMSHPNRTKKDCGLVYQQLSEELKGPATPKLSRYAPLHNVTVNANTGADTSPFHQYKPVPEAV